MITDSNLSKIINIMSHAHLIANLEVHIYQNDIAYRTGVIIKVLKHNSRVIDYVFINVEKTSFNAWKKKTWNKRKQEIPLQSFEIDTKNPEIIRLGFK